MQNCLNQSCHKNYSVKSNPSDYCSEKCWVNGEYTDMSKRRIIKTTWGKL